MLALFLAAHATKRLKARPSPVHTSTAAQAEAIPAMDWPIKPPTSPVCVNLRSERSRLPGVCFEKGS